VVALQHLDDARAGHVQVVTGIAVGPVRKVVEREEEHEGAVDAFGVEDLPQLGQVRGLADLVADVVLAENFIRPGEPGSVLITAAGMRAGGRPRGMMSARAVAMGLPGRLQRVGDAATAAGGDRDKHAEILTLRHQIAVLERQLGQQRVHFTAADRALLAALLHRLPRQTLRRLRLLVRPDTVLRWHRDLIASRHAVRSRPKRPGRRRTVRSIRALVLRLARENPGWGYRRLHGELPVLGVKVAPCTVWEILKEARIDPAPDRSSTTWADFLRSQSQALLACDFFETVTLTGTRMFVLAVIEHHPRRIRVLGATAHPCTSWVTQAARNLIMDLQHAGCRARFLIRDRDGKFPELFDALVADAGIEVVLTGVQMPRMNAIMERWVRTCRPELLDRTLIWNQHHLLRALREFEAFYNTHRPHQGIANARPLRPLPPPITDRDEIAYLDIRRQQRLGGILNEYRHAA
jgi:putative transposase